MLLLAEDDDVTMEWQFSKNKHPLWCVTPLDRSDPIRSDCMTGDDYYFHSNQSKLHYTTRVVVYSITERHATIYIRFEKFVAPKCIQSIQVPVANQANHDLVRFPLDLCT